MRGWRVTGTVAVVLIDGSARYLDQGTVFRAGDNVEHLERVGLVEPVDLADEQPAPQAKAPAGELPAEATDMKGLSVEQLRDYAAAQGIDLGAAQSKNQILAVIKAAAQD